MKPSYLAIAAVAILATAGCNADKSGDNGAAGSTTSAPVAVDPPKSGDWTEIVTKTEAGGFMMGNPNAKVKLIEFGSMTCPHCADFEAEAIEPLTQKYVKTGQVAFEFRNFVRDAFDVTASIITRCGGADSFFPLTKAMYADQMEWIQKIQSATPEQQQAFSSVAPAKQSKAIADLAGFQQWAAMRGVPNAKTEACLLDQDAATQLVQMQNDAVTQFDVQGTPTFVINGKVVEGAATWEALEPKIKEAL